MRFGRLTRLKGASVLLTVLFSFLIHSAPATAFQNFDAVDFLAEQTLQFPFVPHASMTTGSLCDEHNKDFERLRYDQKIPYCRRNVSTGTKSQIYDAYGVPQRCRKEYTIDHFIPLSIGGTNHRNNLWPEHQSIKALRANLENDVYGQVASGKMTQREAVEIIIEAKLHPPVQNPASYRFCP